MFPTFISILDIQSWWEVPSIAHFCSLFRTAFNLLDFDIEDLEEALLTDGTEETSWLQELIVRLLSGCLPNNEISTFNYQMFLRRLFRQKCQEHDQYNPFNTDVDFQLLPLRTKVDILHALCDFRLDADDVLDQLKNLEADSLRVEPLGYDNNDSAYWYFYGTRLYREDFNAKGNKKKSVWQVICFTEDDWFHLNKKFKRSTAKCERQLYRTLSENFLPELPRLFREKERLARKRLLENQPRRTSRRLRKEASEDLPKQTEAESKNVDIGKREAHEKCNSEDSQSTRESRYEMGSRHRKSKQRKLSSGSSNSATSKKKKDEETSTSSKPTTIGRQTNNSLAAATGQIVIQQVANPHKKKLKTSQVFRQTDEDLITGMHKILDYVKNHEDAWPFADPVDEEYAPNYYSVIRKPMDLQRMEERLDAGYYKNFSRFRDDFQLIVDNCRLYNGAENEYTEMVGNLSKVFERATEKFLDQISSSDDEIAVEFPSSEESKDKKVKRKPSLAAKIDKKVEHSLSEESQDKKSLSYDSDEAKNKKDKSKKKKNKEKKSKHKKEKCESPVRSRSPSTSPPPSSPDTRFDFFPKKHFNNKNEDETQKKEEEAKPKDKHNKLRETIEKLKAKSEITNKLEDLELDFETLKENKEKKKDKPKKREFDDNSGESPPDKKKKKNKNAIDALTIATEQTLKDINKWLDDTPKFSEFSSASNSPSYPAFDEFDNKGDDKKKIIKKDSKDFKRRGFTRDPAKFLKRREIQRTIDRLQPGKSKGNLISNVQSKQDEVFSLLVKNKDTKNSLIVKTDDNAPKLSLGSVLDSFGRHKFVDDAKPEKPVEKEKPSEKKPEEKPPITEESMMSSATPNLSAWFKAFGAPKVPASQKKDAKEDKPQEEPPRKEELVKPPEVSPVQGQPTPRQRRTSTGSSVSERSSFSQDMDSPRVGIDERLGAYPAPYPSPMHRSPSRVSPREELSPKANYPPFNGQIRVGFYQDTVSNKSSPDKSQCSPRDNPQSPYAQCNEHVYPPTNQAVAYPYPHSPYIQQQAQQQPAFNTEVEGSDYSSEVKERQFPVKKRVYSGAENQENFLQQNNGEIINYPTPYTYNNENYPLNIPTRTLASNTPKIDLSKYTNMGYTGEVNYQRVGYSREQAISEQPQQDYPPSYTAPQQPTRYSNQLTYSGIEMGNMPNLSHIVDRYSNDLSTTSQYYEKVFNKPISTTSALPMFNQGYGGGYREGEGEDKQQHTQVEKRGKKRKTAKSAPANASQEPPTVAPSQGFQSYTALKPQMEPSAISLKSSSVVPGSAFNFAPSPSAALGLYDNPNFLDDFRTSATPSFQRQPTARQSPAYPFMAPPAQATPPAYYMAPSAQATPSSLMDPASPLYQHYVLNQGLLGPATGYPPSYHPALSMRQQYDAMTRPPWL